MRRAQTPPEVRRPATRWTPAGTTTTTLITQTAAVGSPYSVELTVDDQNGGTDTTAVNGTIYSYVVTAIGAGGEGVESAEVRGHPLPNTAVIDGAAQNPMLNAIEVRAT